MTNKELDAWIAKHVMGWKILPSGCFEKTTECGLDDSDDFEPTTDGFYAMMVLKKCAERENVNVGRWKETWVIGSPSVDLVKAEPLELAICRFAKELFSKEDT